MNPILIRGEDRNHSDLVNGSMVMFCITGFVGIVVKIDMLFMTAKRKRNLKTQEISLNLFYLIILCLSQVLCREIRKRTLQIQLPERPSLTGLKKLEFLCAG